MTDWNVFEQTLKDNFGTLNPERDAASSLDDLQMDDNQCILEYNVAFQCLSAHLQWEDRALTHRYYTGLCDRIKDELAHLRRPTTLVRMREAANQIDQRYWERHSEITHAEHETSHSGSHTASSSDTPSDTDHQHYSSGNHSDNHSHHSSSPPATPISLSSEE